MDEELKNKIKKLEDLKFHIYKIAIKGSQNINDFLNKDFSGIKYFKRKNSITYTKDVLRSKNILPLVVDKLNIDGEGIFYCQFNYNFLLDDRYFEKYWIMDAMSSNMSLEEIKQCMVVLKDLASKEDIKRFLYLSLLNNEHYKRNQNLTYEHFFCLVDFILDTIRVKKLKKEVEEMVDRLI